MRQLLLLTFLLVIFSNSFAGVINGYIYNEDGEPLPYATVYVQETRNGTVANENAFFELRLPAGTYTILFQFLGYKTEVKKVDVSDASKQELKIILKPEAMVLQEIKVTAGKEDPAYAIMRRAIAKAGFHLNQLDSFSARVYIKGTGNVTNIPFLIRKRMEKEGIDTSKVFITESVNEVSFKRPDTYHERVISIRSSGDDNNTNPNSYIFTSFYKPEVVKTVSPFSPKAFAYYRFEYEGTFNDRGYEVSKIKVIPRSRGDNVFEGYLNIVEELWSIHSFTLKGTKLGFKYKVNQIHAPIKENIWMQTTAKVEFEGSFLGFAFEYKYLASVSDYILFINPDLDYTLTVVDEKTQPDKAEEVDEQLKSEDVKKIEELVATKEVNRKQLKKLIKEYEKIERKSKDDPDVVSTYNFKVDSNAYRMDSLYWAKIRPIPLTSKEEIGYHQVDSIAEIEKTKAEGDTVKVSKKKKGFQAYDLLLGDSYKVGDKASFSIKNVLQTLQYNTVEGLVVEYEPAFSKTFEDLNYFRITPTARYSMAREEFTGKVVIQYGFGVHEKRNDIIISGGRYINQFNPQNPIHPVVNSFMTLLLENNYMKIYEQDYATINFKKKISDKLKFSASSTWSERQQLYNNSTYRLIDRDVVTAFLPNQPLNLELSDTSFPTHEAFTMELNTSYQPWLKYRMRNKRKIKIESSSPTFDITYRTAKPLGSTEVEYDHLELGFRHSFFWGIRGKFDIKLTAGTFLNNKNMYFMDYKHFMGNQTPLITADPVGSFRMLDYYNHSTNDEYLTSHIHYQFRKLLLTRIFEVRMMGLRENVFVNYLTAPTAGNYVELGYSLDYILRFLRVEVISSFRDGKYQDFGVRLGIATNLGNMF